MDADRNPTPWRVEKLEPNSLGVVLVKVFDRNGNPVIHEAMMEQVANRICMCVNVLSGIPDAALNPSPYESIFAVQALDELAKFYERGGFSALPPRAFVEMKLVATLSNVQEVNR